MISGLALIDMNNFYVSCERLFRPDLQGKPVIVLSNNDGCAVARSQEAKDLGIKMGDPWFKIRTEYTRAGGIAFSSNYTLYGDLSARIGDVLGTFSPDVETYSIDESFVRLTAMTPAALIDQARAMRSMVQQWIGIPCCVGLAQTKTLAKLANYGAKKRLVDSSGVLSLLQVDQRQAVMARVAIADVWGVGPASATKLAAIGVTTAADLAALDRRRARQLLGVVGERTAAELAGVACLPLELAASAPQGCAVTRSFGRPVTSWADMEAAVANYATRAAAKLRRNRRAAGVVQVFMHTSPFRTADTPYSNSAVMQLAEQSADSRVLIDAAVVLAGRIWRDGYNFSKAGVILADLVDADRIQQSFLSNTDRERAGVLMETMDRINRTMGAGTIVPGSAGVRRQWAMRAERRTPRYTTQWAELPVVRA